MRLSPIEWDDPDEYLEVPAVPARVMYRGADGRMAVQDGFDGLVLSTDCVADRPDSVFVRPA